MYRNVFFFHTINGIGGVETFFYELAKKYHKKYDITVFYVKSDEAQLKRLKQYVRAVKWEGQEVECEKAFFNYNLEPMISHVHAKHVYEIIHADFLLQRNISPHIDDRIDSYIAVSNRVRDSFFELTGVECEVCANPLTYEKTPDPLFIVSAQRMTSEKGGDRIAQLVKRLDRSGIAYYWMIFTDTNQKIQSPNVIYRKPRLDVRPFIQACDLFVAVSDSEGRCYSVGEKLASGSGHLLITPCPSFFEQGCDDENSIVLEFDMSNIDDVMKRIKDMYDTNKPERSFAPKKVDDLWGNFLVKGKSDYKGMKYYHVRATELYKKNNVYDVELGCVPSEGTEFIVDGERLEKLLHSSYGQLVTVDERA